MSKYSVNPADGAINLLVNCLKVKADDKLLVVREPDETLYCSEVAETIAETARDLGAEISLFTEPVISNPADFPSSVSTAMQTADHTIFLSRLGDYVRFLKLPGNGSKTTCYIYTKDQLTSPYATLPHQLMATLRDRLESELLAADEWRITCPLGSDISGSFDWASLKGGTDDELLVSLFPVSTFKPVSCGNASGNVALSRWLMPGGSTKMEDQHLSFSEVVNCEVQNGLIKEFHGTSPISQHASQQVTHHYDRIANTLKINRNRVHSWHLGINPQTFFPGNAEDNMDTWSALSFASPRYLHFHTCGDEPPGEVAWSLFNCDVTVDNKPFWQNGNFCWLNREDNKKLINRFPQASMLFDPSLPIGL